MANPFDQFDVAVPASNPFDQFDAPSKAANGVISNIGDDWNKRLLTGTQDLARGFVGQQSMPESLGQAAGQVAGGIWDVPTEVAKSAWGDIPHGAAEAINESSVGQKLGNALMQGGQSVSDVTEAYPRATRNAEAVANLMGFEGAKKVGEIGASPIAPAGQAIYDSGKASADAARHAYVQEMVLPKETPTVKAEMATRMAPGEGWFGRNTYIPTPFEQQVATTVSEIPGVNKGNGFQKNLSIIKDENSQLAEALKARLQANDVNIPDDTIINTITGIRESLPKNTTISAPGEQTIERVVNAGIDHITAHPQTASGMLEARKAFDSQMIKERGDGVFDPSIETPRSNAISTVRQAMNKMVSDAVPSAEVLTSLQKQSHIFNAMENMAPKAAGEWPTKIGRTLQKYTPTNLKDTAQGLGAIYAAKEALPFVPKPLLAAGLLGYGAYKGATAPATRMALGKALGASQ